MMIVLPDLHHVDPSALKPGHIIRVTDGPLAASDLYGVIRAIKRYPAGWRIRWDIAVPVGPREPSTGVLHVPDGELVSCVSREQWRRLCPRRADLNVPGCTARPGDETP